MYKNTFFIVFVTQIISLVITFMSSFAICRMKFKNKKLRNFLYDYYLIGISVPIYILLFPVYRVNIRLGVLDTPWSLILPYIAITIPFNTLLFVGFMRGFPRELEEKRRLLTDAAFFSFVRRWWCRSWNRWSRPWPSLMSFTTGMNFLLLLRIFPVRQNIRFRWQPPCLKERTAGITARWSRRQCWSWFRSWYSMRFFKSRLLREWQRGR